MKIIEKKKIIKAVKILNKLKFHLNSRMRIEISHITKFKKKNKD